MNLTRCNNGHFYDKDKFDSCPHCKQGTAASEATVGVSDATAGTDSFGGYGGGQVTEAVESKSDFAKSAPVGGTETTVAAFESGAFTSPLTPGNGAGGNDLNATQPLSGDAFPKVEKSNEKIQPVLNQQIHDYVNPASAAQPDQEVTVGFWSDVEVEGKKTKIDPVVGWLVCIKGEAFGKSFLLKSGKNFIGRDRKMDVPLLEDKSVSRECHAICIYDPKSRLFLVQPGTSRELFYLNDKVVLGVEAIKASDVISVGKTDLMFVPFCGEHFSWEEQIEKLNAK